MAARSRQAYDAYWFLYDHPKFKCREALFKGGPIGKGQRLRVLRDKMPWAKDKTYQVVEFGIWRHALQANLDIHYALVNSRGVVGDDISKNTIAECWLEFGPIKYEVMDGHLALTRYHDIDLDCGAATFDEALVKLARLVRKHYGTGRKGDRKRP